MLREDSGHPLAVFHMDTGRRHQTLHRHVCGDAAVAYLLLDRLWQQLYQRQASRYPAHAAIKPPRQLIQSISKALL